MKKIPIIDITDLYHPYQDPGDNFDILTAYALPEIDLKAVLLDVTEEYRRQRQPDTSNGSEIELREPGIIPVAQCNYIFGKSVKYGIGAFERMKTEYDRLEKCSKFMNASDVLIEVLRDTNEPVHILCFGSLRILAAAYNREPELLKKKIARIHVSAGSSGHYLEWNVLLDPLAFVRIMRSDLPIYFYPCATENGPFDIGANNTYWKLDDISFVHKMHPQLRRYMTYVFSRSKRPDFLNCLENDIISEKIIDTVKKHNVWETAIWMNVAGRALVKTKDGYRYLPKDMADKSEIALREEILPCRLSVNDEGYVEFCLTSSETNIGIYSRGIPDNLNYMLGDALAALYTDYTLN